MNDGYECYELLPLSC